jgi:hypothetical protein
VKRKLVAAYVYKASRDALHTGTLGGLTLVPKTCYTIGTKRTQTTCVSLNYLTRVHSTSVHLTHCRPKAKGTL